MIFEHLTWIVEGLGAAFGNNVEVVLHDLTNPSHSVLAIANGTISGREPGSPILSAPLNDVGLDKLTASGGGHADEPFSLVTGYRTRTRGGRELQSTTMIFRDSQGEPFAALCINIDRSRLRQMQVLLHDLLDDGRPAAPRVDAADCVSVDDLISQIIEDGIAVAGKPVTVMTKEDKIEAVRHMNDRGLFLIRSSVDMAAASLSVSRFTIYNYLDELKKSPTP